MGASFDNYVSERYDDWVAYAEALCLKYGVKLEAREVVNESFRVLLERNGAKLDRLIAARPGRKPVAEFMMKRIIRFRVSSPRSSIRYRPGQKFTSESSEETPFTDLERRIFVWVAVEGKRLDDWPGEESRRKLFYKQRSAILKVRLFLSRQKLMP